MSENLIELDRVKNLDNQFQDDVEHQTSVNEIPPTDKTCVLLDGSGSGHDDIPTKKKKTRRGKPKRRNTNPYMKLSWQQRRLQQEGSSSMKVKKLNNTTAKGVVNAPGQALAPYNNNQFLIEDHDHGYLKEIEERLKSRMERLNSRTTGQSRTRDSSFSVDSDIDYYSSPEDEEEFLTKEFSNTYQDIRTERLNSMTREELMQECIQMENRLEVLTKCLSGKSPNSSDNKTRSEINSIQDFQLEIRKLMNENKNLRRENERLRKRRQQRKRGSISSSMSSSMDSESDSSSSTSTSDSDESNMDMDLDKPISVDYSKTNGIAKSPESSSFSGANTPVNEDVIISDTGGDHNPPPPNL